jgi:hypothetical protein
MPAYATSNTGNVTLNPVIPAALWPGDSAWLFGTSFVAGQPPTPGIIQAPNDTNIQFEAVTVNERSIAVSLASRPGGGAPPGVSILVWANANPGAMEVDIQNSPMDADGFYLTPAGTSYKITTWTQVGGSNNWFAWVELEPLSDVFVTLKVISNPNSVKLAAKLNYV